MKRQEWIKFITDRINQMEAFAPAGGRIVLDLKQATDLLNALHGATEEKTAEWIDFFEDDNGIRHEQCGNCFEYTVGKYKRFCSHCGAKMV